MYGKYYIFINFVYLVDYFISIQYGLLFAVGTLFYTCIDLVYNSIVQGQDQVIIIERLNCLITSASELHTQNLSSLMYYFYYILDIIQPPLNKKGLACTLFISSVTSLHFNNFYSIYSYIYSLFIDVLPWTWMWTWTED